MQQRIFIVLTRLLVAGCLLLTSCRQRAKSMAFYYWKTSFNIDAADKQVLHSNAVHTLYTRYFDVDFLPGEGAPRPIAPIAFDTASIITNIIPVVYIKNRVWDRLDAAGVDSLTKKVNKLINGINQLASLQPREIQFDCDWTETTRDKYFLFLKLYKSINQQVISATIRLHQVKYAARTGIPPVNYGVLMYYNMGDINAGSSNSIYDKAIAASYTPAVKTYPLVLDVALPIFAWGLQIRDGKVVKLLNKMNFLHFENDSNFTPAGNNRYAAKHAGFHGGYYFKENDTIKTEHVPEKDLLDIVAQVNRYSNHRIRNIIFYDFDKENLVLYDETTFRKIMDHLN